jgi:hypothetical protein
MSGATRFSTSSGRSTRFFTVCELVPIPSIAVYPSHQADDIGARFVLPSGLRELIRTTGVPKYRTFGSTVRFILLERGCAKMCEWTLSKSVA